MNLKKKAQTFGGLQGFVFTIIIVAIVLSISLIILVELGDTAKTLDTTIASNESVTLTAITQDVIEDSITMTNTTADIIGENLTIYANGDASMTGTLSQIPITALTMLRNTSGGNLSVIGDCNITINTGAISCNYSSVTNHTWVNFTFAQFLTGTTTQNYLTTLTALRNTTGINASILGECNITTNTGVLNCNHSFVDDTIEANYTYNKNSSSGVLSQSSLYIGISACRNSDMTSILVGTHCNISSDTTLSVNYDNFTDNLVYVDYSHYVASAAYNSTGTIITKLATVPTWIGIIIIMALAFMVLAFFIGKRQ